MSRPSISEGLKPAGRPPSPETIVQNLKEAACDLGFGFARIAPFKPPPYAEHLQTWLENGSHGEMAWLARDPDKRADPKALWPEGRSILTVGMNYYQSALPMEILTDPSHGRFARYAWGLDYHDLMLDRLKQLGEQLPDLTRRSVKWRAYVDTGPLLERPISVSAGAGFLGKNTLMIERKLGSWFFLGELLLDLELLPDETDKAMFGCGDCHRCGESCPTGALDSPWSVDAPKCISYLTIESKGPIPRGLRSKMGNWIYGCDVCQDVCPYNARGKSSSAEPHFLLRDPNRAAPLLTDLIKLDDEAFQAMFRGSAVKRTKRRGLLRNVAVALGNWGEEKAVKPLATALSDSEPLIRGHAAWALGRIPGSNSRNALEKALIGETDGWVLEEIRTALEERP